MYTRTLGNQPLQSLLLQCSTVTNSEHFEQFPEQKKYRERALEFSTEEFFCVSKKTDKAPIYRGKPRCKKRQHNQLGGY